jgi:hypothetical protein
VRKIYVYIFLLIIYNNSVNDVKELYGNEIEYFDKLEREKKSGGDNYAREESRAEQVHTPLAGSTVEGGVRSRVRKNIFRKVGSEYYVDRLREVERLKELKKKSSRYSPLRLVLYYLQVTLNYLS